MKPGTILFVLVVIGYFAFEMYAVSKVGYRMEPLYIFERFVAVDRAMTRCGQPDAAMKADFNRNRASVQQRAKRELFEQSPEETQEDINRLLTETIQREEEEVDDLIDELGCDDIELFKLMNGYENRAHLNLAAPDQEGND